MIFLRISIIPNFRSLKKLSMNRSTVPCMHSCASDSMRTRQTLNLQNVRLPPLSDCCLANARMSLKIELLFPPLTRREPESSATMKRRRDLWPSGRCWAILNSSVNWANWKCCTTQFCTGNWSSDRVLSVILPKIFPDVVNSCWWAGGSSLSTTRPRI